MKITLWVLTVFALQVIMYTIDFEIHLKKPILNWAESMETAIPEPVSNYTQAVYKTVKSATE